jgi:hypothetical protein
MAVFNPVWETVRLLAACRRLLVHEVARDECLNDELRWLFDAYPVMVVRKAEVGAHHAALLRDAGRRGIQLARPTDVRDKADPYVIALGLAFDGRSPRDLTVREGVDRRCQVVTLEGKRGARSIPKVCAEYGLAVTGFVDLLRRELH